MAKRVIMSDELLSALRAAGLCDDDTRRVVIDIEAGAIPVVYTEKFAAPGQDLLSVATALGGVQIKKGE